MTDDFDERRRALDERYQDLAGQVYAARTSDSARGRWRWWVTVSLVVVGSVGAAGLILFGAVRFLAQADAESDRVECIRVQVQAQARSNAGMATVVLDSMKSVDQRREAVAAWSKDQARIAESIGRC